jgi:hypothetical protein
MRERVVDTTQSNNKSKQSTKKKKKRKKPQCDSVVDELQLGPEP